MRRSQRIYLRMYNSARFSYAAEKKNMSIVVSPDNYEKKSRKMTGKQRFGRKTATA